MCVYVYIWIHRFAWRCMYQKTTALYESISCNQYDPRSQYRCRATELSIQCSVVVFYTQPYICMCVCVCVYLYSVLCPQNRKKCSSRILSAFGKRRLWVLSNKRFSTIQYLILVLANKIVMMHRVTLCLLLEGTLEGQNCLLWCVFLVGRHPIKPAWKRLASLCHSWKYHFYLSYKWYSYNNNLRFV